MIKVFTITEDQKDRFNNENKSFKDFPRIICRINQTTNGYKLTIEGIDTDVASYIEMLHTMGIIFNT
jgi:hypothetical protein